MKTLKKNDEIVRVADGKVNSYLSRGYNYCPKVEWKKNVRDVTRVKPVDETTVSEGKKHGKRK